MQVEENSSSLFFALSSTIKPGTGTTTYLPSERVKKRGKYVCVTDLHKQYFIYKRLLTSDYNNLQWLYLFKKLTKSDKAQILGIHLPQPGPFDPVMGYSVELFVFDEVVNVIGPPCPLFARLSSSSNLPKGDPLRPRWSCSLHTCPAQPHFPFNTFLLVWNFVLIFVILILSFSLIFSMDLSMEFCVDCTSFSIFFL